MKHVVFFLALVALSCQPVFAAEDQGAAQSEPSEEQVSKCTNEGVDKGLEGAALDEYVDNCLAGSQKQASE